MNWWVWLLIILGLFGALGITFWGFWSAFLLKSTKNSVLKKIFYKKTPIKFGESNPKISQQMSVVCLVVGKQWKEEDEFWPIYIFGAQNPQQMIAYWTKKLEHDYYQNHQSPIINYLQYTNQKLEQISFYILDQASTPLELNQKISDLLLKTNLKKRGFNKSII